MVAYYNEIDPKAAAWLRELIKQGHIADGDVDERDIKDVRPTDLEKYAQCHFFAGIGCWSYALRQAGWPDDQPVWTGSCPCQPFSTAGKGAGFDDKRHLWPDFHWLIKQCRPNVVFGEQVSRRNFKWMQLVCEDTRGIGYRTMAVNLEARMHGENHERQRFYWVADTYKSSQPAMPINEKTPRLSKTTKRIPKPQDTVGDLSMANGSAIGMDLCRGYGNAIVIPQAAAFIRAYQTGRAH